MVPSFNLIIDDALLNSIYQFYCPKIYEISTKTSIISEHMEKLVRSTGAASVAIYNLVDTSNKNTFSILQFY